MHSVFFGVYSFIGETDQREAYSVVIRISRKRKTVEWHGKERGLNLGWFRQGMSVPFLGHRAP